MCGVDELELRVWYCGGGPPNVVQRIEAVMQQRTGCVRDGEELLEDEQLRSGSEHLQSRGICTRRCHCVEVRWCDSFSICGVNKLDTEYLAQWDADVVYSIFLQYEQQVVGSNDQVAGKYTVACAQLTAVVSQQLLLSQIGKVLAQSCKGSVLTLGVEYIRRRGSD